jgi:ribosomal protein S18 acetylase RimI-like enzyme
MLTLDRPTTTETTASPVAIAPLTRATINQWLPVVIRGMRDNPQHVAALGKDLAARESSLRRMFGIMAKRPQYYNHSIVAVLDGEIVGVCGLVEPGQCQPSGAESLRMLPGMLLLGIGKLRRISTWLGAWAKLDLETPHWHIGPVAVDAHLQGQGIGTTLMTACCNRLDVAGGVAWLETDKEINVRFYQKFGFDVVAEQEVLGVRNWFMSRQPRQTA